MKKEFLLFKIINSINNFIKKYQKFIMVFLFIILISEVSAIAYYYTDTVNTNTDVKIINNEESQQIPKNISDKPKLKEDIPYDYLKDKRWHRSYAHSGDGRDVRYGVAKVTTPLEPRYLSWKGKISLPKEEIERLVRIVYKRLPHIRTTDDSVALMVETIIAESYGGYYTYNKYGDCGLCQVKTRVSKDTLLWLRYNHKDIYDAIVALRNPKLSEKDNLINNVYYNIAMGITVYWRMVGYRYKFHISTPIERAEMWKSKYNTRLGAGTVQAYQDRNRQYRATAITVANK